MDTEYKELTTKNNNGNGSEKRFLEGPQSRASEFFFLLKIIRDFIRGFRVLHFINPCVTVFGSARYEENHAYYKLTRKVGSELAELGFSVLTGGGPGLMEAANRGAKDVSGVSIGCNIKLPKEQKENKFLDKWVMIDYFFVRKVLLTKYSYAFVVMPGGFGTLDELFEAVTLMQTKKSKIFPVVVFCREFYDKLIKHVDHMIVEGTISPEDKNLILFTDNVDDAVAFIKKNSIEKFNLKERKKFKPSWILNEK